MGKKNLIYTAILFILLSAAAFFVQEIQRFKNLPAASGRILEFPVKIGAYKGEELSLEGKVYEILNTDTILFRRYSQKDDFPVWFLIVYAEQDRQSFHPPEYCYLGGGNAELLEKGREAFDIGDLRLKANKLLLKMPEHRQLVYYWYTAGKKMTSNYYAQQWFFVKEQIMGRQTGGTLIRVSTVLPPGMEEEQAKKKIEDFLKVIFPEIKKIL